MIYVIRAVRSFFMVRYKRFKISYFFFRKYFSRAYNFFIRPHVPVDIIKVFSLISDFLVESLKANKNWQKRSLILQYSFARNLTHFIKPNSLDIENNMLPQRSQKPTLQICHCLTPRTAFLKSNVCIFLYISIRKFLFQRRSKILSGGGFVRGVWTISFRWLAVWAS